jgi:hypothetical protein
MKNVKCRISGASDSFFIWFLCKAAGKTVRKIKAAKDRKIPVFRGFGAQLQNSTSF